MKKDILNKLLYTVIGISVLYIVIFYGLTFTELHFREWVKVLGIICTGISISLIFGILLGRGSFGKHETVKRRGILFYIITVVCFCIWGFFVFLFLIFNVNEEKRLTKTLLVTNEAEFLQENKFIYYEPVAFFFKRQSSLTQEKKQEYLEEKYGKDVVKRYGGSYVHIYQERMELKDTLVEEVMIDYVIQALEDLQIDRDYFIKEYEYVRSRNIYLELKSQEDIVKFSKDVSEIFAYIENKTEFFEKYRGVIYFYSGEEENQITGYLPLGRLSSYDNLTKDYYLDSGKMEALVLDKYVTGEANLKEQKAYEEEMAGILGNIQEEAEEMRSENESSLEEESGENVIQNEGFYGEKAAKRIYDEYLEAQGYAFEIKYNAKGNLYIELESRPAGEPEDKSKNGFYEIRLIYDRPSKNGACELFVLQRTHYSENYVEESSVILNMYAVETATGQVVEADKQSWGAPGTEEYRTITGE